MQCGNAARAASTAAATLANGGEPPPFLVVALGKWGGMELNFSSDIDLFFVREDGSDHWHCEKVARRTLEILSGSGADHLYRTDLRLRPGGPSAALVPSVSQALEEIESRGGTWERMVYIRARAVCGMTPPLTAFMEEVKRFTYETPFHLEEIREVKGVLNSESCLLLSHVAG